MATKVKDRILKGQITFTFFEQEKVKVKNTSKTKKKEIKLKPIKSKHIKRRNIWLLMK